MTRSPRLFLSAGDTSGDQHAARLVRSLRERIPDLAVEGLGGPELINEGVKLHADLVSHAIIGFGPAIQAAPKLLGLLRRVAGALDKRRPDVVVLVDYPGFNLFVARLAKKRGIPVVYFVAPQLWAWAPWRVKRFARVVDEAHVIFPFEEAFFGAAGIETHWVGHPLIDGLPAEPPILPAIADLPRPVALLPGSRPREVHAHMTLLLRTAQALKERHHDISFHTAHVSAEERANMAKAAEEAGLDLQIHGNQVHEVMASCRCALVASGTATLETAVLGTPLVVFYRITPTENQMRKVLLVPPFIGQVNLVSGREVTPELLLTDEDPQPLIEALEPLLTDTQTWAKQRADISALRNQSLEKGAIERSAELLAPRFQ